MSVINKKEFFLIWTKQYIKNVKEKFQSVNENSLARELLKENGHYQAYSYFIQNYGDAKISSQLVTNPFFMLDLLIVTNNQEFYLKDCLDTSQNYQLGQTMQTSNYEQDSPSKTMEHERYRKSNYQMYQGYCYELTTTQCQEIFEHILQLIKAFFKKRMLDGKNLFKILLKCCDQDDIKWKIFELLFLVCFFCKDMTTDLDFYNLKSKSLNIFNNAFNSLHSDCNPMLTKCVFQVVGEALKQFTLTDIDHCMPFLGQEEIFMRKAHKINLNEDSLADLTGPYSRSNNMQGQQLRRGSNSVLVPSLNIQNHNNSKLLEEFHITQSRLGGSVLEVQEKVLTTQPSGLLGKDYSLDTFNLTPVSSNRNTPRGTGPGCDNSTVIEDDKQRFFSKQQQMQIPNAFKKLGLKTIQSLQDEEDRQLKIEELENQVFTLQSENQALKKNLEAFENELVNLRENEEAQMVEKKDLELLNVQTSQEFKDLKYRYSELEQHYNEMVKLQQHHHQQSEALQILKSDNTHLKQINLAQQSEIQFLNNQIEELQQSVAKKEKELVRITQKYEKLKEKMEALHDQTQTEGSILPRGRDPLSKSKTLKRGKSLKAEFKILNQTEVARSTVVQKQSILKKPVTKAQGTQVQEEQLGIFTEQLLQEKIAECKKLKERIARKTEKMSFLQDKSIRQDDSLILHDLKLKRAERTNKEQSDEILELNVQIDELKDKYKKKRRELKDLKLQNSKSINPNFIATIFFSLLFTYLFSRLF